MKTAEEAVAWALEEFRHRVALTTSFQKEGMVVLDIAARLDPGIRVITLDTGRLPEETYGMIETVRSHYGIPVETVTPDAGEVERMVTQHGPNLFHRDVPSRVLCCRVRKVRPLERRTKDLGAVLTGLRRGQSSDRAEIEQIDRSASPLKISPLAYWSAEEVESYTLLHGVPVHPLYARGYVSIGCAPCSRPSVPGEPERASRWWWEDESQKECGIHFTPDGKVVRSVDILLNELLVRG